MPNTPPAPNPYLRVDPGVTGSRTYYATDASDPRFHLEASIRTVGGEHVLSFIVVAQLPDGTRGRVRGGEFFAAMMDHFGDAAVDVVEGQWEATNPDWATNLEAFNRITGSGTLTEAAAAAVVPTGKYATRRGYSNVVVLAANPVGARGRYTEVLVWFRR